MKLMTYNLLNGATGALDSVVKIVEEAAPDILVLNEANGFDKNNNQTLSLFASQLGFPYFDLAVGGDGHGYHVAILSKLALNDINHLQGFARAAIAANFTSSFGQVSVIATHLSPTKETVRLTEAERIIEYQKPFKNRIVMGDLNSLTQQDGYDSSMVSVFNSMQTAKYMANDRLLFDVMKKFADAGYIDPAIVTKKQKIHTAPTAVNELNAHSNMRLDYILLSQNIEQSIKSYAVVKNEMTEHVSDHYPVVVELQKHVRQF